MVPLLYNEYNSSLRSDGIMTARLERILYKVSQQHAPILTPPGWNQTGDPINRIQKLARALAGYNITILVGELAPELLHQKDQYVQEWVRQYALMYHLLAQGLFPSFGKINAQYADDRLPPVIVFYGEATPIVSVLSGYITPYVAVRQATAASDLELRGLMTVILDELEAGDLPHAVYDAMLAQGVNILKQMLQSTLRHVSLTLFDKPIIETIQQTQRDTSPPKVLEARQLNYELEYLPEDNNPPTPTEEMFVVNVPLRQSSTRRPPVPNLPDQND